MVGQIILGQLAFPQINKRYGKVAEVLLRDGSATEALIEAPAPAPVRLPESNDKRPSQPQPKQSAASHLKNAVIASAALVALLGLGLGGSTWWQYLTTHEETDDAYTTGHMHPISARINDTVQKVLVDDNEHVKAGQPLVLLDPNDYQVRVQQAIAALSMAKHQADAAKTSITLASSTATGRDTEATGDVSNALSTISKAESAVLEAKAAVPEAQAVLAQRQSEQWRASVDYGRFQKLAEQGAVSLQQRDQALRDFQVATEATKAAQEAVHESAARLQQAQEAVGVAKAQLTQSKGLVQQAQAMTVQTHVNAQQFEVAAAAIAQAQAQLSDAELQLSYTKIVAPIDGRVGKKTVEEGQRLQPGQELMEVVSDDVWVVANFKETQLEHMRPGQAVEVKIDSFPHQIFTGKVDSFSPGSGATFALLPPDNATGNFTKIVQRVPVKVVLDRQSIKGFEQLVVPGMSAVVTVTVSH